MLDLDEIEQVTNAATKPPWGWETLELECGMNCTPDGCLGHDTGIPTYLDPVGINQEIDDDVDADQTQWIADANFIAAARTWVPLLIARVRELEALLRQVEWVPSPEISMDSAWKDEIGILARCPLCGNYWITGGEAEHGEYCPWLAVMGEK